MSGDFPASIENLFTCVCCGKPVVKVQVWEATFETVKQFESGVDTQIIPRETETIKPEERTVPKVHVLDSSFKELNVSDVSRAQLLMDLGVVAKNNQDRETNEIVFRVECADTLKESSAEWTCSSGGSYYLHLYPSGRAHAYWY